jgi:NRAMP (natural resistance-associated macrophage protein)-like metal ion transporter
MRIRRTHEPAEGPATRGQRLLRFVKRLGPGIITGMADDDPAGIATFAVVGASTGFSLLWLVVLTVPMLYSVEEMSARIGIVTRRELQPMIIEHFGRGAGYVCAAIVVICNVATIAADIGGIASGIALLTGLNFRWFVVPIGLLLAYLLLAKGYKTVARILLLITPLFFLYVIDAVLARPDWGTVLSQTFLPHTSLTLTYLLAAVGLLGTTISPYLLYWQTTEEIEADYELPELKEARFDVGVGMLMSNVISYFVIVCTAAVLFPHPALRNVQTAAEAAVALRPLAGEFAFAIFAVGLIVVGLLAVPVLASSTAYVAAETLGKPFGLNQKFRSAPGFYLVIFAALAVGALADFAGLSPVQMLFYSQVLDGLLMPVLLYFLIRLADDPDHMGVHTSQPLVRWIGWATLVVMASFGIVTIYQFATLGPGG